MEIKLKSGIEVEYRSLTFAERKRVAASLARRIQDFGSIANCNYDVVDSAVLKIDGKEKNDKTLVLLDNADITELSTAIIEISGFSKKKQ